MDKHNISIPLPGNGINLVDDSLIDEAEAAEGTVNISFKDGIPQTRKGYIKAYNNSFDIKPKTLFNYIRNGERYLLAAAGYRLKYYNGEYFTTLIRYLNSDNIECLTFPFKFADPDTFSDKCFFLDGKDYMYYDGGADTFYNVPPYTPTTDEQTAYGQNVLTTAPDEVNKQKYILNDNERVWVAGYNRIVRISHLQRPDYFPSSQVWKLQENCTGMAKFMDEVILFTENTTTLISGSTPNWELPDKYVYKALPGGYGCKNHRSIAEGDNAIYWANRDGVYRYRYTPSGFSIPECVSDFQLSGGKKRSVSKWLKGITDWSVVHAQYYNHEYRLYVGNKKVIVFDSIRSTWTLYEYDQDFLCSVVYDKELYYVGDYIYKMDHTYDPSGTSYDGLNDDGVPIKYVLKSKFFDFNKSANQKKFKKLLFTLYSELISYDIDVNLNIDNDYQTIESQITNKVSRWGAFSFGDRITTKHTNLNFPIKINHRGKKYNIQYELVCEGLNMAFMLTGIDIILKIKELK